MKPIARTWASGALVVGGCAGGANQANAPSDVSLPSTSSTTVAAAASEPALPPGDCLLQFLVPITWPSPRQGSLAALTIELLTELAPVHHQKPVEAALLKTNAANKPDGIACMLGNPCADGSLRSGKIFDSVFGGAELLAPDGVNAYSIAWPEKNVALFVVYVSTSPAAVASAPGHVSRITKAAAKRLGARADPQTEPLEMSGKPGCRD